MLGLIAFFLFHAIILIGLISIVNEGEELDIDSALYAVIISVALAVGWNYAADYLTLHVALRWLSYIPLAALVGLAIALVSGISIGRAMGAGALYVAFLMSWTVFLVLVCILLARIAYQKYRHAASKRRLKEHVAQRALNDKT